LTHPSIAAKILLILSFPDSSDNYACVPDFLTSHHRTFSLKEVPVEDPGITWA
jgi:hypothetical protein